MSQAAQPSHWEANALQYYTHRLRHSLQAANAFGVGVGWGGCSCMYASNRIVLLQLHSTFLPGYKGFFLLWSYQETADII